MKKLSELGNKFVENFYTVINLVMIVCVLCAWYMTFDDASVLQVCTMTGLLFFTIVVSRTADRAYMKNVSLEKQVMAQAMHIDELNKRY